MSDGTQRVIVILGCLVWFAFCLWLWHLFIEVMS
jgi:hypothetical protein